MGPVSTREKISAAIMATAATAAKAVSICRCTPPRLVINSCTEDTSTTAPMVLLPRTMGAAQTLT